MITHLPTAGALVIIIHAWSTRLVSARASRVIMHGRLNSPPACDSPVSSLQKTASPIRNQHEEERLPCYCFQK